MNDRIESIARQAAESGLVIVGNDGSQQPTVMRTEPSLHGVEVHRDNPGQSEADAILAQWKQATNKVATEVAQSDAAHLAAMAAKARAEAAMQRQSPQQSAPEGSDVPQGRNAPKKHPGLRFVAIVIDGQVVEGMTATERLMAALTSEPEIIDVTDRAWLPEVGDYYHNGSFIFNPEGGAK